MDSGVGEVVFELAHLQKNRGLQSGDLSRRIGPRLAQLTGFAAHRDLSALNSLGRQLIYATQDLPPDLRFAFLKACSSNPKDPPTLSQRLEDIGRAVDRSPRAARRRVEQANHLVATKLLETARDDAGWFLGEFTSIVDYRDPIATYLARRTLVVTAPTLSHVTEQISLPGADGNVDPQFQVQGAARLADVTRSSQTWVLHLELDQTYACGDLVGFESSFRIARHSAPPMSLMSPRRDCWRFSTAVELGDHAQSVWVLDGVTPPTADDDNPDGAGFRSADSRSPHAEFTKLTPGLVYGLRWRWRDPGAL